MQPLRFVVLLGSLRKASFHATLARSLPALAPEGVSIELLESVGDIPHTTRMSRPRAFQSQY